MKVAIELQKTDLSVLEGLRNTQPESIELGQGHRFGGSADLVTAFVTLSSITIPILGKIIIEQIRAKKYVKVKINGVEITGISEENALLILEKYNPESKTNTREKTKHNKKQKD